MNARTKDKPTEAMDGEQQPATDETATIHPLDPELIQQQAHPTAKKAGILAGASKVSDYVHSLTPPLQQNEQQQQQESEAIGDPVSGDGMFAMAAEYKLEDKDTSQRVFHHLEIDTDKGADHRAVLERNVEISKCQRKRNFASSHRHISGKKIATGELDSGVYRGQGAYRQHMEMREGAISGAKFTG